MKEDCRAHFDKISACLDGELAECELDEIMLHVETCPCCKRCLSEIEKVRDMIRKVKAPQVPDDLKSRLKACLMKDE
jgi:anti-sigma factor RsiW